MIDVTQELFSGKVYPGDTPPRFSRASDMAAGDECTVTDISMCAHNGTHVDAPAHYIAGGKAADALDLARFYGTCAVRSLAGGLSSALAGVRAPRLLIKGGFSLTEEDARALAARFVLVGCEAQSIGDGAVHRALLREEVAVLEGLDLSSAPEGEYVLCAFPLKLGGADGAPVRAVLLDAEDAAAPCTGQGRGR